jgi:hypothetical protein
MKTSSALLLLAVFFPLMLLGQHDQHGNHTAAADVEPQPLLSQAMRLQEALSFSGNALQAVDAAKLKALERGALTKETVAQIQSILDPYCLNVVHINPEGRVKVDRGTAKAVLKVAGRRFWLKSTTRQELPPSLKPRVPTH